MIRIDPRNPRGIVWLASYPKSGNTWVRAFLVGLQRAMTADGAGPIDINRMTEYAATDLAASLFEKYLDRPIAEADPAEVAALRPKVHEDIAREADGIVFIKTHNARILDRGVPLISLGASAGALYILRNPLDVAISVAHFREVPIDQAITDMATPDFGAATEVKLGWIFSSWSENVKSWTERRHPAVLTVRYEDLLDNPTEQFRQIANHVSLWPEDSRLEQAIESASFRSLQRAERKAGFKEKPDTAETFFREGRAGQWREVLTPAQIDRIVSSHGEQMARFGYLPQ
jgi:hypothetical protein